jgi:hypothetical protein
MFRSAKRTSVLPRRRRSWKRRNCEKKRGKFAFVLLLTWPKRRRGMQCWAILGKRERKGMRPDFLCSVLLESRFG